MGGDITGHFRGALQAMASGVMIAQNILREEQIPLLVEVMVGDQKTAKETE